MVAAVVSFFWYVWLLFFFFDGWLVVWVLVGIWFLVGEQVGVVCCCVLSDLMYSANDKSKR